MQRFVGRGHLLQRFDTCRTAFLCCDIQDRLRPFIKNFDDAVDVSNSMSQLHQLLGADHGVFLATAQAPSALGPVSQEIVMPPGSPAPFAKTQPSMLIPEVLLYIIGDEARGIKPVQQVVLWGHETQVCIINTADDLVTRGIRVAILCDGCASQRELDHQVSLQTMSSWDGLVLTTVTGATLQLTKGDEKIMKEILRITKDVARKRKERSGG